MSSFLESLLSAVRQPASTMTISLATESMSVVFPVLPTELRVQVATNHGTVNINAWGEYLMLGKTGLKTLTLASFFPAQDYPFARMVMSPYTYISQLESMRTGSSVCQLTVSDTPLSMPCVISSFSFGEKDSSGDVYFELGLTEYRYIKGQEPTKGTTATGLTKRPTSRWATVEKNITYYPGDSLGNVLGRAIGSSITLSQDQFSKFDVYRSLVRSGGVQVGDVIRITATQLKRNDTHVPITTSESNK